MNQHDYYANLPARHYTALGGIRARATGGWKDVATKALGIVASKEGSIVALVGKRGTGKTMLAVYLAAVWMENNDAQAYYVKVLDAMSTLKNDMANNNEGIIKKFNGYGLLVLDEWNVRMHSEWENMTLTNLIDKRYDGMKHTVIISNQTPEAFQNDVGLSIWERLKETGTVIEMNWDSFR